MVKSQGQNAISWVGLNGPGVEVDFAERASATALLIADFLSVSDRARELQRIHEAFRDLFKLLSRTVFSPLRQEKAQKRGLLQSGRAHVCQGPVLGVVKRGKSRGQEAPDVVESGCRVEVRAASMIRMA